jgi:lipoyl(octanoyl) transferase
MSREPDTPAVLEAYLLGSVAFEPLVALQRRLVYEVSGERSRGVLILCELSHQITLGRDGSRAHVNYDPDELWSRGWPVRWVNRGGGCLLHAPGQLQIVFVAALDAMGHDLPAYLAELHDILTRISRECGAAAEVRPGRSGVWVQGRLLAHVGVAVHDWVGYFGASLNIDPDLELFRGVQCDGEAQPMTSLARERRGPVRPALVRQRLVEAFADHFGFPRTSVFHHHPALASTRLPHEYAYRSA